MQTAKQRTEQVDACWISQFAKDVDRIVRPERNPVREISNISDVEREIAEIVRRLDFQFLAVDIKQPAKGAKCENGEKRCQDPFPCIPIFNERRMLRHDIGAAWLLPSRIGKNVCFRFRRL